MLPSSSLVDKNSHSKVRAHFIDTLLAQTPLVEVCGENGLDILGIVCREEVGTKDIVVASMTIELRKVRLHVWQQTMLFDSLDLSEPEAQAEGEWCLPPLGGLTAMLRGEGAKATSSCEGVVNAPRQVYGKEREEYVAKAEDCHGEVK